MIFGGRNGAAVVVIIHTIWVVCKVKIHCNTSLRLLFDVEIAATFVSAVSIAGIGKWREQMRFTAVGRASLVDKKCVA